MLFACLCFRKKTNNSLFDAVKYGHFTLLDSAIIKGTALTARDTDGATLLHRAISYGGIAPGDVRSNLGYVNLVGKLINAGANINASTKQGITPLMVAANSANPHAARSLLAAGADPLLISRDGRTALSIIEEIVSLNLPSTSYTQPHEHACQDTLKIIQKAVNERSMPALNNGI